MPNQTKPTSTVRRYRPIFACLPPPEHDVDARWRRSHLGADRYLEVSYDEAGLAVARRQRGRRVAESADAFSFQSGREPAFVLVRSCVGVASEGTSWRADGSGTWASACGRRSKTQCMRCRQGSPRRGIRFDAKPTFPEFIAHATGATCSRARSSPRSGDGSNVRRQRYRTGSSKT